MKSDQNSQTSDLSAFSRDELEALNSIVFDDDSQVCSLKIDKWYSEDPRVEVDLEEIDGTKKKMDTGRDGKD